MQCDKIECAVHAFFFKTSTTKKNTTTNGKNVIRLTRRAQRRGPASADGPLCGTIVRRPLIRYCHEPHDRSVAFRTFQGRCRHDLAELSTPTSKNGRSAAGPDSRERTRKNVDDFAGPGDDFNARRRSSLNQNNYIKFITTRNSYVSLETRTSYAVVSRTEYCKILLNILLI